MKMLLLSLMTILASNSALAANSTIQCSLTLMSPVPWAPSHFWIPPETGVYDFSYKAGTEKVLKIGVKNLGPNAENAMYKIVAAKDDQDTVLSVEFSRITPDGSKMTGKTDFGYYLRRPSQPKYPVWALGGYSKAAGSEIDIAKDVAGYVVMNCRW